MKLYKVYITDRQYNKIKELAKKYGVSWSEMLRRILDKGLEKNAKNL